MCNSQLAARCAIRKLVCICSRNCYFCDARELNYLCKTNGPDCFLIIVSVILLSDKELIIFSIVQTCYFRIKLAGLDESVSPMMPAASWERERSVQTGCVSLATSQGSLHCTVPKTKQ